MNDTLAERFRTARKKAGLSRMAAAAAMGVGPRAIQYWEEGKREPGVSNIREAARVYAVSLEWLIGAADKRLA